MDAERIYRMLRRVRPAAIVHVGEDGTVSPLALAAGRGRWEQARDAIMEMLGARGGHAELRDAGGAVLRVVRAEQEADAATAARETVGAPTVGAQTVGAQTVGAPTIAAEQERLLALMLKAQHEALNHQAALLRPLIDGYQELAAGFASYAAQTVELVKIAQSAAEARVEASAAASAQNDQLSQMLASVASRMGIPTQ
jgi:hypothetical protein